MAFGDNAAKAAKAESTHVMHFALVAKDDSEFNLYKMFQMLAWPETLAQVEQHKFNSDAEYLLCKAVLSGKSEFTLKASISKVGVVKDRSELGTVEL